MISESDLIIKELSLLHMEIKEHDIFFFEMGIKELHFRGGLVSTFKLLIFAKDDVDLGFVDKWSLA